MAVKQLSDGNSDGWMLGQSSSDKGSFFGVTTEAGQQAIVTTVDSTTITALQVATATTTHIIPVVNALVTDSRAQAKAINQMITKLRNLGLFASS